MANVASHRLLVRLYRDLAELCEQPYPGVAVFLDDADIRKLCIVLIPPAGPWKGIALHFRVRLPLEWPSKPPIITSSVQGIDHPNLLGEQICCDLLIPMEYLEPGYSGGYSPALTLQGLFIQFLTFFSGFEIEQSKSFSKPIDIGDSVKYRYVLEPDLYSGSYPWNGHSQNAEEQWDVDPRPEATLPLTESESLAGIISHKVKGSVDPQPDRIHLFMQRNSRWQQTYSLVSKWSCKRCPYGSPDLPHVASHERDGDSACTEGAWRTPASPTCKLHLLNDDMLLEIASHIPTETVIIFGRAYPRFHHLASGHRLLLVKELHCFFLRIPLRRTILGVGVTFTKDPPRLASDCDWLSLEAFEEHHVRKDIRKRNFEYFVPLAFNQDHFQRAREEIWKRVAIVDKEVRRAKLHSQRLQTSRGPHAYGFFSQEIKAMVRHDPPPHTQAHRIFNFIYKMMNSIIVSLMESCDDELAFLERKQPSRVPRHLVYASEKAVTLYCLLLHLLICLCRGEPAILRDATEQICGFLRSPSNRTKESTPDLGEFMVAMTLVHIMDHNSQENIPTWSALSEAYIEEAIIRNVRWLLQSAPELEIVEKDISDYRVVLSFSHTKLSYRTIMFQVAFQSVFTSHYRDLGIEELDLNYGFPEGVLPERMVEEIKEIYKVEDWAGFFQRAQYAKGREPGFARGGIAGILKNAVGMSEERGYHYPSQGDVELSRLKEMRKTKEKAWLRARI